MRSTESMSPSPDSALSDLRSWTQEVSGIRPLHLYIRVGWGACPPVAPAAGQRVKLSLEGCLLCAHCLLDSASSGLNHGKATWGRWLSKAPRRPMREWWVFTFLTTSRGSASAQQVNSNKIQTVFTFYFIQINSARCVWVKKCDVCDIFISSCLCGGDQS